MQLCAMKQVDLSLLPVAKQFGFFSILPGGIGKVSRKFVTYHGKRDGNLSMNL